MGSLVTMVSFGKNFRAGCLSLCFFAGLSCTFLDGESEDLIPEDGEESEFAVKSAEERSGAFWKECYINGAVAVVNDRAITAGELRQELTPLLPQIEVESTSQEDFNGKMRVVAREVLDRMVERALIVQEFEKDGNRVPEMQKNFQLDEFIRIHFQGDRLRFIEKLHGSGKSLQQFKKEMEEGFIVDWMLGRIRRSRTEISPLQVREYYESHKKTFYLKAAVKMRQIFFHANFPEKDIGEVMERLRIGEDFAVLLDEVSPHTKRHESTWIPTEDMGEDFAVAVSATAVGDYVGPLRTKDGSVIVLILEKREGRQLPIAEVQDDIEGHLLHGRLREAQEYWLSELRRKAHIKIYL
ncbi:MAG: peptidyl-prolyl cis-trans isomerase [Puniceicoccales bacterium]|nr:peptidyl-prolyl cis-trans isomerase [Puniceicoccales bacterium]